MYLIIIHRYFYTVATTSKHHLYIILKILLLLDKQCCLSGEIKNEHKVQAFSLSYECDKTKSQRLSRWDIGAFDVLAWSPVRHRVSESLNWSSSQQTQESPGRAATALVLKHIGIDFSVCSCHHKVYRPWIRKPFWIKLLLLGRNRWSVTDQTQKRTITIKVIIL